MKLKYKYVKSELDGSIVAVPVCEENDEKTDILRLNSTAAFIFDLLSEDISEDDIVKKVIAEYDGDEKEISDYVRDYLNNLIEKGIVQ